MIPWRPRCLTVAATAILLLVPIGCGEGEIDPPPTHSLAEPWQAQPFAVDESLVRSAEKVCRDTWTESIPAGMQLLVVDARGAGTMLLLFVGAGGHYECFVDQDRTGQPQTTSGGGGSGPPQPPLAPNEVVGEGAGSQSGSGEPNEPDTATSYVIGRAGANVAAVEVVLASGGPIRASLNRGWFAAWWPTSDNQVLFRAFDAGGNLVGSSK